MRQLQGEKKPLQKSTLCEKKKKKTQDLNAVFNHLAVPLTQHGSLHVSLSLRGPKYWGQHKY